MKKKEIVIVGAGAQAKYVIEIIVGSKQFNIIGIIDICDNKKILGKKIFGIKILGRGLNSIKDKDTEVIIAHRNNFIKEIITLKVKERGLKIFNAIHPKAVIARTAKLGEGIIINAGAIIQPFAEVGDGAMIHAGTIVEHDNKIEEFANLAPGVKLAGGVRIGGRAYIYTGAVIVPNVTIGRDAVVGAGAVVLRSIKDREVAVGVPARVIKRREEIESKSIPAWLKIVQSN